ncbi:YraN family protein [Alkalibacter sp. M17DMB]|nr:YraN family protein [Alkalibacter mobilis]
MSNQNKGKFGESLAVDYLKSLGYSILKRNYRCRMGEIDIIAKRCEDVIFVEVKSRSSDEYGAPSESVPVSKQKHIIKTALHYLGTNTEFEDNYRFDVIELLAGEINHIENAFGINW